MSEFPLTFGDALQLLNEVIDEFGEDYVYGSEDDLVHCFYLHGDDPGCGVGHVLVRAGVPLDVLRAADEADCSQVLEVAEFRRFADDDALQLLADFQAEQDARSTWGKALAVALAPVPVGGSDV